MTPQDVITEVRRLIQDESAPLRYSDTVLLGFVNQTLKRMAVLRPDLFTVIANVSTTANVITQTLPAGSTRLVEVFAVASGAAVEEVDRDLFNRAYPSWSTDPAGVPTKYMRHPRNPTSYFLYPRPQAGVQMLAEYVVWPINYTLAAILSGLPNTVPGYSVDRWCAGAMTSVTTIAGAINMGAYNLAIAGGVEHMGNHPMGEGMDPNPRYLAEKIVDTDALSMGNTAERLHDKFPHLTKERADKYALASQEKIAAAYKSGKIQPNLIPVAVRNAEQGWGVATVDEPPRPGTTLEALAALKTPFRPSGRVTAGNAAGLNDGATAALLASESKAKELGLGIKAKLVTFAFAGVEPEIMGYGPVPSTLKVLS